MSVKKYDLLIGGQMCPPASGQYYPLYSPVDGTLVAEVADASRADVDRAAAAAREAFYAEWKFCGIEHKRALFAKLKEVLYAMADELAAAKVQPQGGAGIPPLVERVIDYYVGKLDDGAGALIEHGDQGTNYVYREPLGVVAIFAPFNGPMLASLLSAVPALVAGNTVVLKAPDQEAPQALKTMQAFHEAGFPAGVINALSGKGPEVGQALVAHPGTRLISFTGSTVTGKKIMAAAAEDLKRVQLNLGNKTAQIVLPDADLEAAATATVGSAFPGQACSAISRVLLHESLRDEFIALLKEKAQAAGPSMLIDRAAVERVERYVEMGKAQGSLLFGGAQPPGAEYAKGCYFEPTAFAFADQSGPVCRDEIFGPVVSVLTFASDDEALALANDTDYGLLVSLWTLFLNIKRCGSLERGELNQQTFVQLQFQSDAFLRRLNQIMEIPMPRPDLKTTFNTVASLYDEVRPGYPDELVRDVLDLSGMDRSGKILEVGCGTGQASRLFATLGCEMICLDIGQDLIEISISQEESLIEV